MIGVRIEVMRGRNGRHIYRLAWAVPEVDAAGVQLRYPPSELYPNGRPKVRVFREVLKKVHDRRKAESWRLRKQLVLNGLALPTAAEPVKRVTLDELIKLDDTWLANRNRAEGTRYLSKLAIEQFRDSMKAHGRPPLADGIMPADVESFIADRKATVKAKVVNNAMTSLRATFNRAVKHGTVSKNPFARFDKLQETPKPIVPLTTDEEGKLLTACADDLELEIFTRLALDTGCRAGEIANLRVDALDLDKCLGRIECTSEWKSKTRRNRPIAYTPATASRLRVWLNKRPGAPHVFKRPDDSPKGVYRRLRDAFENAVDRSGIGRKVTPQDCRRTVASLLAARGINQKVAAEFLGHTDITTTAKYYQAVQEDTLRGVVVSLRPTGTNGKR
jgi:integrase